MWYWSGADHCGTYHGHESLASSKSSRGKARSGVTDSFHRSSRSGCAVNLIFGGAYDSGDRNFRQHGAYRTWLPAVVLSGEKMSVGREEILTAMVAGYEAARRMTELLVG